MTSSTFEGVDLKRGPGLHRKAVEPPVWVNDRGVEVTDVSTLTRLRKLAIPPAWTDVWASPEAEARIQATGLDARARTQYKYNVLATARSAATKYEHMLFFAEALPSLRKTVATDLMASPDKSGTVRRDEVLAVIVRLLERGLFRVGNERYAKDNHTYGLTTLQRSQVRVSGGIVDFDFIGKEHLRQHISVTDADSARVIASLLATPGAENDELFVTDGRGRPRSVQSSEVNAYLHAHTQAPATAKLFRTWGATTVAAAVMAGAAPEGEAALGRSLEARAVRSAAALLGNTPTVARGSYIHPAAFRSEATASLGPVIDEAAGRHGTRNIHTLFTDEALQAAVIGAIKAVLA